MEELEKVELVREKCDVSYEEAREALKASDYDVLDAIVQLERAAKEAKEAVDKMNAPEEPEVIEAIPEIIEPEEEPEVAVDPEPEPQPEVKSAPKAEQAKAHKVWNSFRDSVKRVLRGGLDLTFVAERNGEEVFSVPVLFVVIGLLMWGAAIWLMVIGLFFGFRYRTEGASPMTINVNEAMDKAADLAEDIKRDIA